MDFIVSQKLILAAGLGLLVGMQREWTLHHVAGVRTFTLMTLSGAITGLLVEDAGLWLVSAGLIAVVAMLIVGNLVKFSGAADEPGLTTQTAALVMYLVGVSVAFGHLQMGIFVAGGTAVLLHWKKALHSFVRRMGEGEIRAIIHLILIALVIQPILPDRNYGPYGVLNPFEIWSIVVLIVGISLAGYVASRWFGSGTGSLLAGIFGGLISSTATTVSYSRKAKRAEKLSDLAALVILIASTVVFARVLIEVALIAPDFFGQIMPPLIVMMFWMVLISLGLFWRRTDKEEANSVDGNPSELKAAIFFGLLYAAVLFSVAAVRANFGNPALYLVAFLSGLTDMDAITLSTANMLEKGRLTVDEGWRMILLSSLSNLLFKGVAVAILGPRRLLVRTTTAFAIAISGGIALLLLWP